MSEPAALSKAASTVHSPSNQDEDLDLVQRVASGDEEALESLYVRYSGPVYSLCLRILQHREEAEEALQDVFVRLWKRAHTYRSDRAAFFTWLIMLTRSICIDRLRKRKSRPILQEELSPETSKSLSLAEDTRIRILMNERSQIVRQKLEKLPDEQRICIEMAFFGGQSHSEIAHALDAPLGTVKARIRRGLLKLRELFG